VNAIATTTPGAGRRRRSRRTLDHDEILDAALDLLDAGGIEATSVRGIAAKVGVAPNAVYTYYPDKAAVLAALSDRILGDVDHDVFADRSQPWRARLESVALELRQRLAAHPSAVPLMIRATLDGPHARALNEQLVAVFIDVGLDPDDAARATYLMNAYVFGSLALQASGAREPLPRHLDAAQTSASGRESPDTPPVIPVSQTPAGAGAVPAETSTEQYLWGLRRLLDGLGALATGS
jgi:TetR/AcrR family transcriptional regulator, tetracycline repressor protein